MNKLDFVDGYDVNDDLTTVCEDDWKRDEKYYWETKEGEMIPIDELTNDHIINIVILFGKQLLERKGHKLIVEKFNEIRRKRKF